MKKTALSLMFVLVLISMAARPAYALFGAGDIVFDPKAETTRIIQLGKDILTAGATLNTQINTWNTTLKLTILDPLGNAMIAMTLLKQQANTINMVTGSLGGNSLLIANPQQWINNKGLDVVRISLGDISQQKGPYTDSLMNSVVNSFKSSNLSLQTTLNNINSSSIPTTVQNNLCSDAQLTQVAKNDVMKPDGSYDPAQLAARKKEIYNALCVGDPSTNPQLAQKLTQVNSQRPDIAGWDSWLAVTGGENAYTKSVRANQALAQAAADKKQAAQTDLNRGGGVASPSKCTDVQKTAPNGDAVKNIADAACRTESLTNTGSAVNGAFQAAVNAPMARLQNSFGSGILGTLSMLLSARNTLGLMANAFSSATGGSVGGNVSVTVGASSTTTGDLIGNPDGKNAMTDPILTRLKTYSDSLDKLETADNGISMEINVAQVTTGQIQTCYQNLMSEFKIDDQYPGLPDAFSYIRNKNQSLTNLAASVQNDSFAIASARAAISDLTARMNVSNSTSEINDLYTKFEAKISDGTFPSDVAGPTRDADYQTLKGDNQTTNMLGGDAYQLNAQCSTIRQQLTPRESA